MADRTYATLVGIVQQFGDQPVVREREVSGQTVREFTVKSTKVGEDGKQNLVRISLWPEWAPVDIQAGAGIIAEGTLSSNESKGVTYFNLNPKTLCVIAPATKAERTVVNATDTSF